MRQRSLCSLRWLRISGRGRAVGIAGRLKGIKGSSRAWGARLVTFHFATAGLSIPADELPDQDCSSAGTPSKAAPEEFAFR